MTGRIQMSIILKESLEIRISFMLYVFGASFSLECMDFIIKGNCMWQFWMWDKEMVFC